MARYVWSAIAAIMIGSTTSATSSASELPDPATLKPHKVLDTTHYSEGVVFDYQGNGYVSVCDAGKILRFSPDGNSSVWAECPQPNGHRILADGTHLVCDAPSHAVLRFSADGKQLKPAATQCNGKPLKGPNDIALDTPNGGFYFTDPFGTSDKKPFGTLHYVDRQGRCSELDHGLAFPNGIVLRPGGKELLMAESKHNRILAYDVLGPGKLGRRRVFADLPVKDPSKGQIDNQPDGICLDAAGNLYVAHYGMRQVEVISPAGRLLASLRAGVTTTSNVAFAGPKLDQLYITGGVGEEKGPGAVYRLELGVMGLSHLPPPAQTAAQ